VNLLNKESTDQIWKVWMVCICIWYSKN
jgi:hypothetical protein